MCSRCGMVVCISFATVTLSFSLALLRCALLRSGPFYECVVVRLDDNSGEFMHDMTEWEKRISKWVVFQKWRSISPAFYSFQWQRYTRECWVIEFVRVWYQVTNALATQHKVTCICFSIFTSFSNFSSLSLFLFLTHFSHYYYYWKCVRALFSVTKKKHILLETTNRINEKILNNKWTS